MQWLLMTRNLSKLAKAIMCLHFLISLVTDACTTMPCLSKIFLASVIDIALIIWCADIFAHTYVVLECIPSLRYRLPRAMHHRSLGTSGNLII